MKRILAIALLALSAQAVADQSVNGYYRQDGTYVAPHYRSSPNNVQYDNYSTQGNTNPYTGERGSKPDTTYEYRQPRNPNNSRSR